MYIVYETDCPEDTRETVTKIFNAAARIYRVPKKSEIIISFLTEQEIRQVNKSARNTDSVTDVLSFPYINADRGRNITIKANRTDINLQTKRLMLGEINICLKRAEEQAEMYGHSVQRETGYLALHGLLHILGFDHIEEKDRKVMRRAEEKILSSLEITR